MNRKYWRCLIAGAALMLLLAAHSRIQTGPVMSETAGTFLSSLSAEQRAKATFPFTEDERLNWHFIPRVRKGLPLAEMNGPQKQLAGALMSAGLSQQGYIKATTIMSLDDILRIVENDSTGRRNAEGYYFSVFGDPAGAAPWGYRVEGHHLALNFTVVKDRIASSPFFYGANPAEVKEGPRKGLRALAREEDLAREVLMALDAEQKKVAIVTATAPKDILTAASRKAAIEGQPSGLAMSKMNAKQRQLFMRLLEEYAYNLPDQLAQSRLDKIKKSGTNMHFAWAGVEQRGGPHYYRVQAPEFLIEYDNTQNDANHIHSVWRDYEGDFGLDLLKQHYDTSHRR